LFYLAAVAPRQPAIWPEQFAVVLNGAYLV
jgi:hypothetical protein